MSSSTTSSHESTSESSVDPWSISVKTVGGGFDSLSTGICNTSSTGEKQFTVQVSPEDTLHSLHDQIEATTGLKPSQQRLIYRGRLIGQNTASTTSTNNTSASTHASNSNSNTTAAALATNSNANSDANSNENVNAKAYASDWGNHKIKDIAGLADGQTIHLVKKREVATEQQDATTEEATAGNSILNSDTATDATNDLSQARQSTSTGGGSLLAALLGLSTSTDENNASSTNSSSDNNTTDATVSASDTPATTSSTTRTQQQRRGGWRNSRSTRRPHYRLTAEDLTVPDPGSMEPVRQGLMTLQTLLPHLNEHAQLEDHMNTNSSASVSATAMNTPIEANRQWYQGQWIDCRDTVNQWLEATIVEILNPQDILPDHTPWQDETDQRPQRRPPILAQDPAVSASDLEGRRRLLLEPCDDPTDPEALQGQLQGFRPRSNNQGVQLLLVHYNGWPHRWDEWIRSDSERIRPFRTRTRHPNNSTTALPTPQSVFHEAPRTNILPEGDDAEDRTMLLPELARTLNVVNDMVQRTVAPTNIADEADMQRDLPWSTSTPVAELVTPALGMDTSNILVPDSDDDDEEEEEDDGYHYNDDDDDDDDDDEDDDIDDDDDDDDGLEGLHETVPVSVAPAANHPYRRRDLQNLATLLDRLGRTLTDAAPHVASLAANMPEENSPTTMDETEEQESSDGNILGDDSHAPPLRGLLSLLSRNHPSETSNYESSDSALGVDPDHVDYVSGIVNTTRGEVRSGPRSRPTNDDVANLLGAYLAAASLGGLGGSSSTNGDDDDDEDGLPAGLSQLLRAGSGGGSGSGGIDIHIHAVVTAPGMGSGGMGVTTIGGGGTGGARNIFSSTRRTGTAGSILRSSRNSSSTPPPARSPPTNNSEEDDTGLFSELYSETPDPVDPNGSPSPRESRGSRFSERRGSDNSHEYRSLYRGGWDQESERTSDFLSRINSASNLDQQNTNANSSTRRRHPFRQDSRNENTNSGSNPTSNNGSRRSSGWIRFFRRRRSSRDT